MRKLVHVLTTVAILLHAAVGCCAHDEHWLATDVCEHHDHEVTSHDCHHESEHSLLAIEEGCTSNDPHTPHACTHARCQWPIPEVRENSELLSDFSVALTHFLDSPFVSLFPVGESTLTFSVVFSPHALPVRSHLANCVFLI